MFVAAINGENPTAEAIYRDHPDHHTRSAGTAASARVRLSAKLIQWADIIFVMEHRHRRIIQQQFQHELAGKQMVVLDISDDYAYMDPELIEMIRSGVDAV